MILVDTNVVSAMMRIEAEPAVRVWLNGQRFDVLRIASPTLFEIHYGLSSMAIGRKRRELELRLAGIMEGIFQNRVVSLDRDGAQAGGVAHADHLANGRNVEVPDSMLAGIARRLSAAVATRNTADFQGLGIPLINPWLP